MCRKLFLLALVLGLASTTLAGPTWIGTVSSAWGTGGNWIGGLTPATGDSPFVGWANTDTVPFSPIVTGADNIVVGKLNIGGTDKQGYLQMTGGSLTVGPASGFYMGNNSRSAMANMDMSGGLFTVLGADFRPGKKSIAYFNMTGGTLDVVKFKPGPRSQDSGMNLAKVSIITLDGDLVNADYVAFEQRISVHLNSATMVIDSTAGVQAATAIDAEVDRVIANGFLKPYGVQNNNVKYGVTYSIVKSWNAFSDILTLTAVPEPATIALLGLGGLALLRRRR